MVRNLFVLMNLIFFKISMVLPLPVSKISDLYCSFEVDEKFSFYFQL